MAQPDCVTEATVLSTGLNVSHDRHDASTDDRRGPTTSDKTGSADFESEEVAGSLSHRNFLPASLALPRRLIQS